ncbi:MAG: Hpt domain-containing protein, partial [Clostridiales bacterium]|nr:Hpt domain-containing protein [Clostridiales bacterium]
MGEYDREAMLGTFIYEMNQLLEQLENISIQADDGYTMAMINEIFRIMHTIKGSSAMMMYNGMSTTAHAIEDLFFYLRENDPQLGDYTKITDLTLEVTDFVKMELEKLEDGQQPDGDGTELIDRIEEYVAELKGDGTAKIEEKKEGSKGSPKGEASSFLSPVKHKLIAYKAHMEFEEGCEMENVRAYGIVHSIEDIAVNVHFEPEDIIDEGAINYIREHGFNIEFHSRAGYDAVLEALTQSVFIKTMELKEEDITSDLNFFDIYLKFSEGCEMENVRAYGVVHNISDDVESIEHEPQNLLEESSLEVIRRDGLRMMIATTKTKEQISRILEGTIYMETLVISEIETSAQNEEPVKDQAAAKTDSKREEKEVKAAPKENKDSEPKDKAPVPAAAAVRKAPVQTAISVNV